MAKTPLDEEIEAQLKAELEAFENRPPPEIIPREARLEDPRLTDAQRKVIRDARDSRAQLRQAELPRLPERPAPVVHPLAAELKARHHSDEIGMGEMMGHIIRAVEKNRPIAAGLGLIQLQIRHAAALPSELDDDERTWEGLVATHFPFGLERANALLLPVLYRGGTLRCTGCGIEQKCLCGCGAPYLPDVTERHETSLEKSPDDETPQPDKGLGGRPPIGDKPMTAAERKRRQRQREREPEVTIVKGKILVDPAFFEQEMPAPETPEQGFENSLTQHAGLAMSLPAYWKKHVGAWEKYRPTSVARALAEGAAKTWTMIARIARR